MSAVALPVFAVLIVLELALSNRPERRAYDWRDTLTNCYLTLLNTVLDGAVRVAVTVSLMGWLYAERVGKIGFGPAYWVALFLAMDFLSYWMHRVEHTSRLFWAVHVTHHSSTYFNLTTGIRSSVLQPLYRFGFFAPLCLAGFGAMDIWLVFAASQLYGHLMHTRHTGRLPGWDGVFVTPSHHRVHHASNVCYLDKNMGVVLIVWDRLFGTFARERAEEPPVFGLVKHADMHGPLKLWLHEWRSLWGDVLGRGRARPWAVRLGYVFNRPGWRPTVSDAATRESEAKLE
jgi:sterol desaturase/sphingolipid hydroxylase (fatty acid hydroxylase superfamily)